MPLTLLDAVGGARLDWQVPGHRLALVTALLRTLPKDARRHHTPAADVAAELLESVGPEDGPILDVLAAALSRRAGVPVAAHHLDPAAVPAHLRVTYRAVDDAGRPLAWSKDLPALRRRLAERVREALAAAAPVDEVSGATAWVFGTIPRSVTVTHAGLAVTGHPALVDEEESVGLRVLPSEAEQRTAMWGGTRRLLLLQLGSPLRTLDRALPNATKLALASSPRVSAAEAYRECAAVAVDQLLVEHGGPAWDADGFRALLASVRAGFATAALSSARLVGEVLGSATTIERPWRPCSRPRTTRSVLDARDHLERLLHQGWISAAGFDRLPDLARYLRALEHRVEKARTQPDRDRRHIANLQALERDYRQVSRRATAPGACGRCWRSSASAPSPSPSGPRAGSASPRSRAAIATLT